MCIRDSDVAIPSGRTAGLALDSVIDPVLNFNVIGVDEAQDPVVLDLGRHVVRIAHSREAVSYTHLDVYKRQGKIPLLL